MTKISIAMAFPSNSGIKIASRFATDFHDDFTNDFVYTVHVCMNDN